MARLVLAVVFFAILLSGGRKSGPPEVVVSEMNVHREEELITVAAKVQNATDHVLEGVTVIFRFRDGTGKVVTTQRSMLEEKKFAPGDVAEINGQMKDSPEAATMQVLAETGSGRELRVGNDGPFQVE